MSKVWNTTNPKLPSLLAKAKWQCGDHIKLYGKNMLLELNINGYIINFEF